MLPVSQCVFILASVIRAVHIVWWTDAFSEDVHASPPDSHPGLPHEGEVDFYETNCHWRGCGLEFDTQDELVRVAFCLSCY